MKMKSFITMGRRELSFIKGGGSNRSEVICTVGQCGPGNPCEAIAGHRCVCFPFYNRCFALPVPGVE